MDSPEVKPDVIITPTAWTVEAGGARLRVEGRTDGAGFVVVAPGGRIVADLFPTSDGALRAASAAVVTLAEAAALSSRTRELEDKAHDGLTTAAVAARAGTHRASQVPAAPELPRLR